MWDRRAKGVTSASPRVGSRLPPTSTHPVRSWSVCGLLRDPVVPPRPSPWLAPILHDRRDTDELADPLLAWVVGGLRAPTAASRRASPRDRDARHRALGGSGRRGTSCLTSLAQPVTTPTRVGHWVEQDDRDPERDALLVVRERLVHPHQPAPRLVRSAGRYLPSDGTVRVSGARQRRPGSGPAQA